MYIYVDVIVAVCDWRGAGPPGGVSSDVVHGSLFRMSVSHHSIGFFNSLFWNVVWC